MKDYKEYIEEIERLKIIYNLSSMQILLLQISAAYEYNKRSYNDLKEEFCK